MIDDTIIGVDLFCGAGGFSEGLSQACEELDVDVKWVAINHWDPAVETHKLNHPDALQYNSKVEQLHPPNVLNELIAKRLDIDTSDVQAAVDILVAGPECTHFSNARGGKPVNEQKRMSPWHVVDWLEKLDVEVFILENVKEIQSWGPIEDGDPSRDGSIFEAWLNALNSLGYSVDYDVLNAADYGDPTSRKRFFLIGSQSGKATFPEPTHSDDPDDDLEDWRTASEIIDWSDLGTSIWTRHLKDARVSQPSLKTSLRIAEGIRRHCADELEPFAKAIERIAIHDFDRIKEERCVPADLAWMAAEVADDPFFVQLNHQKPVLHPSLREPQSSGASAEPPYESPLRTITTTSRGIGLATPATYLLRQQDGAHPIDVHQRPVPTIATGGAHQLTHLECRSLIKPRNGSKRNLFSNRCYNPRDQPMHTITAGNIDGHFLTPQLHRLSHSGRVMCPDSPLPTITTARGGVFSAANPYLTPLYSSRSKQNPRSRTTDRPFMTCPASKSPAALTQPFLRDYHGNSWTSSVDEPIGTAETKDRYALCVPELFPWGLDVKYRMIKPGELKQAQGFPPDYEISGTKTDTTKQIGNGVPVNLAKSLCKHLLSSSEPSLSTYGGGLDRQSVTIEGDTPAEVAANATAGGPADD